MNLLVPIKEQKKILKYLVEIPPTEYLKDCDTQDRVQHWVDCKVFFYLLHDFLKNHFAGSPLSTNLCTIYIDELDIEIKFSNEEGKEKLIQRVGLWLDYYLKLYSVISWGWKYIEPILDKLREKYSFTPENPGEALIEVIDDFFKGLYYVYFPEKITGNYYREYSPRRIYDFKRESIKVKHLKHQKNPLTPKEKKLIAKHEVEEEKQKKMLKPFLDSAQFYLSICIQNQDQDSTMRRRLSDLARTSTELKDDTKRHQHPRNAPKGYAINKGVKLRGTKEGGIYRA
jgi:hypothetical protein